MLYYLFLLEIIMHRYDHRKQTSISIFSKVLVCITYIEIVIAILYVGRKSNEWGESESLHNLSGSECWVWQKYQSNINLYKMRSMIGVSLINK